MCFQTSNYLYIYIYCNVDPKLLSFVIQFTKFLSLIPMQTRVLTICQSKSADNLDGKKSLLCNVFSITSDVLLILLACVMEQRWKKLMTKRMEGPMVP